MERLTWLGAFLLVGILIIPVTYSAGTYQPYRKLARPVIRPPTIVRPPPTVVRPPPEPQCPKPQETCSCNCNFNMPDNKGDGCKWELAFKAVKGNGQKVYEDFVSDRLINEDVPEAKMLSSSLPFKSELITRWNNLRKRFIKQAKVEVFSKGIRKAWFLFDAVASSRTSWFSKDNLISSSYDDLKSKSFSFFSAIGKASAGSRFFINENDGPCNEDCGYLVVVDEGNNPCPWGNLEPKPYFLYSPTPDSCCKWQPPGLIADIVIVLDSSGSIDDTEFGQMITFVKSIVSSFTIASDRVRIGVMSFSNNPREEFKLNEFFTEAEVLIAIDSISKISGGTNTADALLFLQSTMFLQSNGNRPGIPDVVVLLTDGRSNNMAATLAAVNTIQGENYLIFTIGIGDGVNMDELKAIASQPDFALTVSNFNSLSTILDSLLNSACPAASARFGRAASESVSPEQDKVADVFAISVKTCPADW